MIPDVVEVKYITDSRVWLRFDDGLRGELDLAQFMKFDGIFEALKDKTTFASVFVNSELGTICWPNGADVAPELLYDKLRSQPGTMSA